MHLQERCHYCEAIQRPNGPTSMEGHYFQIVRVKMLTNVAIAKDGT